MSKNIVFCADGTWNGPGEADTDDQNAIASNVFKLFLSLAGVDAPEASQLAKEQERTLRAGDGSVVQVAKYLHGVGDSTNFLAKLIGGGFGAGLITRIVRGYTFVSRNYAAGDRIYVVGFSRGAYTARALAGLIAAKGLLNPATVYLDDKPTAYRLGAAVWHQWRLEKLPAGSPLDHLGDIVLDLPAFLSQRPDPASLVDAPIEAVAVWDTVGALGIPIFTNQHVAVDVFQFADTALSGKVKFGRHAVAIDEERGAFTPTLWDADPARITQVLFAGGHADVGGGYTINNGESELSDIALQWLRSELTELGVVFAAPLIVETPDPAGPGHREWLKPLWTALPIALRDLPVGLSLSKSVIDRLRAGAVRPDPGAPAEPYRPTNIAGYLSGYGAAPSVAVVAI
jgi:hypothetical protein